jgi:hypothetical protein
METECESEELIKLEGSSVGCGTCGEDLEAEFGRNEDGTLWVSAGPCSRCMRDAAEDAFHRGYWKARNGG